MAQLELLCLGPPRVELDGKPIEVDTRKAIALLAFLAVSGTRHSRDALANLLWPEYDQVHARAALRRTLSTLNKALRGDWLDIDRESVALTGEPRPCLDIYHFQRKLAECCIHHHPQTEVCPDCVEPLTEAVNLYRGDFLAGFSLRDSPNFDDWQFFTSESLRRELAGALERLVRAHVLREEFEAAISHARRWLALDPLHEPAHRQLMQLYTWAGQRAAALRQYRECVRILEEELGVPPLAETTQLYQAIKEQTSPPPAPPSAWPEPQAAPAAAGSLPQPPGPAARGLPLVGRSREWATLLQGYDELQDSGCFVALEGEAGIGKTRLAEDFLVHVRARGGTAISARCYEGETNLAYGPFVEGLRAAINQASCPDWLPAVPAGWLSEAARLLPELAAMRPDLPSPPPLDSPGAQSRFFEAISQILPAICSQPAGRQPGGARPARARRPPANVLFIDDLHWADSASLDLLTYLVRRLGGRPLFILVTWRLEQTWASHRLRHLLGEAQRASAATVLALPRLSPSEVRELTRAATPHSAAMPEELGERLFRETEGLPFFLVEYLAAIAGAGELSLNGEWTMPGSVRDMLDARLSSVSETGWQLLTTAAVIGRSFDFDTLRAASGRGDEETVAGLEALMAQGVIEEVRGGASEAAGSTLRDLNYDFGHEKLRALVYEETSLARRRLLHRRVAEALAHRGRDGSLASQIAYHYRSAGQEAAAARYFKLAGEHARSLYANAEALAHFRAALALGYPDAAALHQAIGDLHTLMGEYRAALNSYETAAAMSAPEELAPLEHRLGNVYLRRGEWELAESHFQAALQALGKDAPPAFGARLYADWSRTAHHRAQPGRALELARQALALAQSSGDLRALAQAQNTLGILASSREEFETARRHLEDSLALADALGDPASRVAAMNNLALACRASGDLARALELTESALALCASQGDRHRQAALHNNLADLYHATGQTEAAMAHLKQAVTIFAEIGEEAGTWQPEIWKLVEW